MNTFNESFINISVYFLLAVFGGLFSILEDFIGRKTESIIIKIGVWIFALGAVLGISFATDRTEIIFSIVFFIFGWSTFALNIGQHKNIKEARKEISENGVKELKIERNLTRPLVDFLFSGIIIAFSVLFFLYGRNPVIAMMLLFAVISLAGELVKKTISYRTMRVYFNEETRSLIILTKTAGRKYPLAEAADMEWESRADVLKLFPLFGMFSSDSDFTTNLGKTLKISLPGEKVYLNIHPDDAETLIPGGKKGLPAHANVKEKEVLPFYHRKNIKRLLGKGYFAVTVKGIGAYAAIVLVMGILKAPVWLILTATLLFWIFNLLVSDRVLKAALDVKDVDDPVIRRIAEKVFQRTGIGKVRLYMTESSEFNGLAAGANIGRSMVILTSETLKLPVEAIEGILAHEAVHVKKRDVLYGQLLRLVCMLFLVGAILLLRLLFPDLDSALFRYAFMFIVWLVIMLAPALYSFATQWMEARADLLGASYLDGGAEQMADSLAALSKHQDEAVKKSASYSFAEEEEETSSLKRDRWFFRLLEFQFMPHPPMYWRVKILRENGAGWNVNKWKFWLRDRFRESCPDRLVGKVS